MEGIKILNTNKLDRCLQWLENQRSFESKKVSNKNDIQSIIQSNAERKKFLLAAAEDVISVPDGIGENSVKPKCVALKKLRTTGLHLECCWQSCLNSFTDYIDFQHHVKRHISNVHVIKKDSEVEYVCLWDVCGFKTKDFSEMVRHINYHSYHAKLIAIGFNGRATLQLARCQKDSTKRNLLPPLKGDYSCMWFNCNQRFNAIQAFFDHVNSHVMILTDEFICSWAGCGATFKRKVSLSAHVRSHTCERLIACYHCGRHFANNRKLTEHMLRQNVDQDSGYTCSVCGVSHANEYLLREHTRQHVSQHACALCDMSAPNLHSLAAHVQYKHLPQEDTRRFPCKLCDYKAIMQCDLKRHMETHNRKRKRDSRSEKLSDNDCCSSSDSDLDIEKKVEKPKKKYACHMCPDDQPKVFARGTRLTMHLVKKHGFQCPFGYSRFRYQISDDGMYRLTTTRYEMLEVSKKIVDGYSGPKKSLTNKFEFNLSKVSDATERTPMNFQITLKDQEDEEEIMAHDSGEASIPADHPAITSGVSDVEVTMCHLDEDGNIIKKEVLNDIVVEN